MDSIFVFPCGSDIGLEIARAFEGIKHVELIGGSSIVDHGKFVFKKHIENIPGVDDPDFLKVISEIIADYKIDYIFPAHDEIVVALANTQHKLACKVIGSPSHTTLLCRSKAMTYKFFKKIISVPTVYKKEDLDDDILFPLFLKPDVGQESKGTHRVNNKSEAIFYLEKDPTLMILEYLPGEEYTVDCFSDTNGILKFSGARQCKQIPNGISVNTMVIENSEIQEISKKINDHIFFRGAWFFQVKRNRNNKLSLLEIAPHIADSMALYRMQGVNLPLLSYYCQKGIPAEILQNDIYVEMAHALGNRYMIDIKYDHVYIDFDDCIFLNGKINTLAIKYLFQCLNEGIRIYLLTRYSENIYDTLFDLRIEKIFDKIIHIKNRKEKKSDYIHHQQAIFIGSSHLERRDIATTLSLPVFSVDSMECLVNGITVERDLRVTKSFKK